MPELPVKDVRLPELQLPEFDRAEIVRALSEIRRPAIELPDLERPTAQLREGLARIDWSRIDWNRMDPTVIDLGRIAAGVATVARAGKPILRSRWTLGVGTLLVIGLAGAALLSNPTVRERAGRTVGGMRARIDARTAGGNALDVEPDLLPDAGSDIDLETLTTMVETDTLETPSESVSAG